MQGSDKSTINGLFFNILTRNLDMLDNTITRTNSNEENTLNQKR